ncbi:MAG: tetratricopeptide repeat protein [Xanthobacteraceae bacterium]|jgi:tetratricopeptide (TPR) repeat protein
MALRFLTALAFAAVCLAPAFTAAPAPGQTGPNVTPAPDWVTPPNDLPRDGRRPERGERTFNLDTLFDALKIAPDAESAKAIEDRIWAVWMMSGSDTCNLLMGRIKAAADAKDYDLAIKLLDAVVAIKPDYVEAWNRRATIYYMKNDYGHALADLREVLVREPRHFGALSGLGLILQEIGDDKHALEAYRKALAIDPHLEHVPDVVKTLREKVEGRDI